MGTVTARIDDVVLLRNDGAPAYNLAVVVDDHAQGITTVVRGDDLAPSTPRQLHLADQLGHPHPRHAHIPLVLGVDQNRLSKRHGAVTLTDLAAQGFQPDHVRSWLANSIGLAEPNEPIDTDTMLRRFRGHKIPTHTWTFSPDQTLTLDRDGRPPWGMSFEAE